MEKGVTMRKKRNPSDVANTDGMVEVFCRFITVNGKRRYPKNGSLFHFWVKPKRK
jgi:hypothetical protein